MRLEVFRRKKERLRERETRSLARPFLSFLGGLGAIDLFGFVRLATLGFTLQENFIIYK